ncbi:MAG: hypothetical protein JST89_19640 [Cyanobacteria bacterium SZAS-4]|nr:hypothetical protein [Cyanobacteria bacterium SZAS-4]
MKLNKFVVLCFTLSMFATPAYPVVAKDLAADEAKQQAKAAADNEKAQKEVSKGHSFRAGRAAKKAEKAEKKAEEDQNKLQNGGK